MDTPHIDNGDTMDNTTTDDDSLESSQDVSGNLTPREALWCRFFADPESPSYGNATKSAERAGYTQPHNAGWRLRKRPQVQKELERLYGLTLAAAGKVMTDLENARLLAVRKDDLQAAIRAIELTGKRLGLFLEHNTLTVIETPRLSQEDAKRAIALASILLDETTSYYPPQAQLPSQERGQNIIDPKSLISFPVSNKELEQDSL